MRPPKTATSISNPIVRLPRVLSFYVIEVLGIVRLIFFIVIKIEYNKGDLQKMTVKLSVIKWIMN